MFNLSPDLIPLVGTVLSTLGLREGLPKFFSYIARKVDEKDTAKLNDRKDLLTTVLARVEELEKAVQECETRHIKREEEAKAAADLQFQTILNLTKELAKAQTQIEMIEKRESFRVVGLEKDREVAKGIAETLLQHPDALNKLKPEQKGA
jgi:esterase/lipase